MVYPTIIILHEWFIQPYWYYTNGLSNHIDITRMVYPTILILRNGLSNHIDITRMVYPTILILRNGLSNHIDITRMVYPTILILHEWFIQPYWYYTNGLSNHIDITQWFIQPYWCYTNGLSNHIDITRMVYPTIMILHEWPLQISRCHYSPSLFFEYTLFYFFFTLNLKFWYYKGTIRVVFKWRINLLFLKGFGQILQVTFLFYLYFVNKYFNLCISEKMILTTSRGLLTSYHHENMSFL